jgi:hypothetical protein
MHMPTTDVSKVPGTTTTNMLHGSATPIYTTNAARTPLSHHHPSYWRVVEGQIWFFTVKLRDLPAGWLVTEASQDGKPVATSNLSSTAAAFSGCKGARINKSGRPSDANDVQLLSPGYPLVAGRTYRWALLLLLLLQVVVLLPCCRCWCCVSCFCDTLGLLPQSCCFLGASGAPRLRLHSSHR